MTKGKGSNASGGVGTFRVRWNADHSCHVDLDATIRAASSLPHGSGWVAERVEKRQVRSVAKEQTDEPGSWDWLDKHGAPTYSYYAGTCIWLNIDIR